MYARTTCRFFRRGTPFQVQDMYRQTALLRDRDYEAGRNVALILVLCIY